MSQATEVLNKSKVFNALDAGDIQKIVPFLDKRSIQHGETLANAGNHAEFFFILIKGTLMIALNEGKALVLDSPGDFIGFEMITAQGLYRSTVLVLEDGEILALPVKEINKLIQDQAVDEIGLMQAWQSYLQQKAPFIQEMDIIGS